ncbi:MAG: hypothetical protein ABI462_12035 [Ignavibacteria bacterium]
MQDENQEILSLEYETRQYIFVTVHIFIIKNNSREKIIAKVFP